MSAEHDRPEESLALLRLELDHCRAEIDRLRRLCRDHGIDPRPPHNEGTR